ncbi:MULTISPECIES: NAD(P)/FAD-dependent oxidoreductase [Amycolatopsis]|uniref:FAD-dependent oxidoreductase n=1 Tax=Amycolatopsis dongchuanensis TaxID=1070866 RepID=A0ABP9QGY5_9PSEU
MTAIVVVGGGQAGLQAADALRAGGYGGELVVVGEEPDPPYQRPPLSKDYLVAEADPLPLRGAAFFEGITYAGGARVLAVDRDRREVELDDGRRIGYSALVLATGAVNRTLPGADLAGVHGLRTLADARALRAELADARSVVVAGAGFIGLEFAAAARARGLAVTVLEAAERPLARAVSPVMSDFLAGAHRSAGVELRLGEGVSALEGSGGRVRAVVGTSGAVLPADVVLVGVGVRPRTELAEAAGLAVDDGVVVDEYLRSADPAVYAIGDCARFPCHHAGVPARLESVQNAADQGRHVAKVLLGTPEPYRELPWFWSHQGPVRLQIAGLAQAADTAVVSGDVASGRFSVLRFREERLVAVESVNRPADHLAARRLLAAGGSLSPADAAAPSFSLKEFEARGRAAVG